MGVSARNETASVTVRLTADSLPQVRILRLSKRVENIGRTIAEAFRNSIACSGDLGLPAKCLACLTSKIHIFSIK
jgi:hypothetical protein